MVIAVSSDDFFVIGPDVRALVVLSRGDASLVVVVVMEGKLKTELE